MPMPLRPSLTSSKLPRLQIPARQIHPTNLGVPFRRQCAKPFTKGSQREPKGGCLGEPGPLGPPGDTTGGPREGAGGRDHTAGHRHHQGFPSAPGVPRAPLWWLSSWPRDFSICRHSCANQLDLTASTLILFFSSSSLQANSASSVSVSSVSSVSR